MSQRSAGGGAACQTGGWRAPASRRVLAACGARRPSPAGRGSRRRGSAERTSKRVALVAQNEGQVVRVAAAPLRRRPVPKHLACGPSAYRRVSAFQTAHAALISMRPSLRAGTGAHRGRAHTLGAGLSRSAGGAPDCAADIAFRFRFWGVFFRVTVTNSHEFVTVTPIVRDGKSSCGHSNPQSRVCRPRPQ